MRRIVILFCAILIVMPVNVLAYTNEWTAGNDKIHFETDDSINTCEADFQTIYGIEVDDCICGEEHIFEAHNSDIRITGYYVYHSGEYEDETSFLSEYLVDYHDTSLLEENLAFVQSEAENSQWLRLKCAWAEDGDTYVYVNSIKGTITRIIKLDGGDSESKNRIMNKEDLKIADAMVKSYVDAGYAKKQLKKFEDGDYEDFEEDDSDLDLVFAILPLFISLIPIITAKLTKKEKKKEKGETFTFTTFNGETVEIETDFGTEDDEEIVEEDDEIIEENEEIIIDEKETGIDERNIVENEIEIEFYTSSDNSKNDKQSDSSEYEKGLKSLYKSGIMTKKELDEMLRKYYSNKEVKKKRKEEESD